MKKRVLEEESQGQLFQHRDNLRREAKQNIMKIQEENRRTLTAENGKKRIQRKDQCQCNNLITLVHCPETEMTPSTPKKIRYQNEDLIIYDIDENEDLNRCLNSTRYRK
ncbi:hypothetical protein TNCV_3372131 [Trichonephila clavipes]|nr:hypothetical protein TNCV_3372131 [Trichonephila clavipes]